MIYIISIIEGGSWDFSEHIIFATDDIDKAKKWVKRFNSIVDDNRERITENYNNDIECFWYDYIPIYDPRASFEAVEYR